MAHSSFSHRGILAALVLTVTLGISLHGNGNEAKTSLLAVADTSETTAVTATATDVDLISLPGADGCEETGTLPCSLEVDESAAEGVRVRSIAPATPDITASRSVDIGKKDPSATPGPDSLPLPSFSGINSPVWLSDRGPVQIADDLMLLALGDVREGLINNGKAWFPKPTSVAPGLSGSAPGGTTGTGTTANNGGTLVQPNPISTDVPTIPLPIDPGYTVTDRQTTPEPTPTLTIAKQNINTAELPVDFTATQESTVLRFDMSATSNVEISELFVNSSIPAEVRMNFTGIKLEKLNTSGSWSLVQTGTNPPAGRGDPATTHYFPFGVVSTQGISTTPTSYRIRATIACDESAKEGYNFGILTSADITVVNPAGGATVTGLPAAEDSRPIPACFDTSPPIVEITAPFDNSATSGDTFITATANDSQGSVTEVKFQMFEEDPTNLLLREVNDSEFPATDTSSPYETRVNFSPYPARDYIIKATAKDNNGNTAENVIRVRRPDTTPPTITLLSPINGATLSGATTLTASATDDIGVTSVLFKINGTDYGSPDTTAPYELTWTPPSGSNGTAFTVTAVATDASRNTTTSSATTVTVDNTRPTISAVNVAAANLTPTSAIVTWTTNEPSDSRVDYSYDPPGEDTPVFHDFVSSPALTTSHSIQLTNLTSGATHSFTVTSRDAHGNTSTSGALGFITPARPNLVVPLTNITISPITGSEVPQVATSITIAGTVKNAGSAATTANSSTKITIRNSTGTEIYNQTATTGTLAVNGTEAESWTMNTPQTGGPYTIRICADSAGVIQEIDDTTTSNCSEKTFTVGNDVTAPAISGVTSTVTSVSATISWNTNESASGEILYGTTASYGNTSTIFDTSPRDSSHSQTISINIVPNTTYHYAVRSIDASGNTAASTDRTFTTTAADLNVSSLSWTAVTEGAAITFAASVLNSGNAPATGLQAPKVRFCMDSTTCLTSTTGRIGTDVAISSASHPLAVGASTNVTASSTWSATIGEHVVIACADIENNITESNEAGTSNCRIGLFTVRPNLFVYSFPNPTYTTLNNQRVYSFSAGVQNGGNASTTNSPSSGSGTSPASTTRLSINVNNDNSWDYTIDRSTNNLAINATESETWSTVWTMPTCTGITGCTHKYKICADATNVVNEGSGGGSNNCREATISTSSRPVGVKKGFASLFSANSLEASGGGNSESETVAHDEEKTSFWDRLFGPKAEAFANLSDRTGVTSRWSSFITSLEGILKTNPVVIYDDVYLMGNRAEEPGDLYLNGSITHKQGPWNTGDALKINAENITMDGEVDIIGHNLNISGNIEVHNNTEGTGGRITGEKIGRFYDAKSDPYLRLTTVGNTETATASCNAGDIIISCNGFAPHREVNFHGAAISDDGSTCTAKATLNSTTPGDKIFYAQAMCFSPNG